MAIKDMFVIDAVVHAIDNSYEQIVHSKFAAEVIFQDRASQFDMLPADYVIDEQRFYQKFPKDGLLSLVYRESATDMAVYHAVPMYGVFDDYSPLSVGQAMKHEYPGRTMVYGPLSTFYGVQAAIDELDRLVEQEKVDGIKFYPWDMIDGKSRTMSLADEQEVYPVLQHALDLGMTHIAVHKSLPLGIAPTDAYRIGDVDHAARDFPDIQFEVVHTGNAFLEDHVWQVSRFKNVWANLEVTAMYAMNHPRKFARIMGELLLAGAEDRMLYSSGASWAHPQPIIEALVDFEMPASMVDEGYPEFTDTIKEKILGLNYARLHGIDIAERKRLTENDDIEIEKRAHGLAAPWSGTPVPAPSAPEVYEEAMLIKSRSSF
ncbi:amidohydrolase family protein [Microbacterium sp. X-17]|uniref:amidohydrolase family protein n=1 Tax=Microbacterium sp. X-17 TaxID=3144404 RepID=UPI0031F5C234